MLISESRQSRWKSHSISSMPVCKQGLPAQLLDTMGNRSSREGNIDHNKCLQVLQ
jgi:hypothetical protein